MNAEGMVVADVEKQLTVCGKQKEITELIVDSPILWDLDNPYLYSCKITISQNGECMDVAVPDRKIKAAYFPNSAETVHF